MRRRGIPPFPRIVTKWLRRGRRLLARWSRSPIVTPDDRLECISFVVDETPYACWEWNIRARNIEFLNGIDPDFYTYIVDAHTEHLDEADRGLKAALAIRTTYAMALETFFALLGALVQAPLCSYGWVMRYKVGELESLVKKLKDGDELLTLLNFEPTIETLATEIHAFNGHDAAKKEWISKGFARAWRGFAGDFLDEAQRAEYNSAKHGLRTRLGGFSLSMGPEDEPGKRARPEAMTSMGGSKFGSSFFVPVNLAEGNRNFRAKRTHRNWVPENMIKGVHLISMSIGNVVSMLKILNGVDPRKCLFHSPDSPEAFKAPWALTPGVLSFSMDLTIEPAHVRPLTKQEILAMYTKESDGDKV